MAAPRPSCSNIIDTKEKLYAIMRAYQCEQSPTLDACRESLGIGRLGTYALEAGAAAAIGKKISKRFQNPHFVLCPLNSTKGVYRFPITEWIIPSAWAACTDPNPLFKRKLKADILRDIDDRKKQIAAQQEAIKQLKNKNVSSGGQNAGLQNKIGETRERLQVIGGRIEEPMNSLPPEIKQKLENLREELINSADDSQTAWRNSDREVRQILSNAPDLSPEIKKRITNNLPLIIKSSVDLKNQERELQKLTGATIKAPPLTAKDQAILQQMEENLTTLKNSQDKLQSILMKNLGGLNESNLGTETVESIMNQLADSNAISPETKLTLLSMDGRLGTEEAIAARRLNPVHRINQRSLTPRSVRPGFTMARVVSGAIIAVGGGMVSAQAAETIDAAADALDPVGIVVHSKSLGGGNCGMEISSLYFPFDKDEGCSYNLLWNDQIQKAALNASDEDLAALFRAPGVCEAIHKNFALYMPKPKSPVNCQQSPMHVELSDTSSFTLNGDYLSIRAPGNINVGYYPQSTGPGTFSTNDEGRKASLPPTDFAQKYPERMKEFNRLKALALSVQACCNDNGTMPPEKECSSYGLVGNEASGNSTDGNGQNNR